MQERLFLEEYTGSHGRARAALAARSSQEPEAAS
jgi:hypothetical protein